MNVDNTQDIVDSREIIERIEELESEINDATPDEGCCPWCLEEIEGDENTVVWEEDGQVYHAYCSGYGAQLDGLEYEIAERDELKDLVDEIYGAEDGVTLIRDSYFEDYARQLAEDIGSISGDDRWPACHIDWEEAAGALQADYQSIDWDGVTYWVGL